MCRRIEEVEPTVGLPRHRHFVGFFNVPVQTPTRDHPFYGYSEKPKWGEFIVVLLLNLWNDQDYKKQNFSVFVEKNDISMPS